jgi:5'-nucleotidase
MSDPDILLTNDDGIEATGLHALHDALSSVGSVTTVAPAQDQSAVGRTLSFSMTVRDHELGYAIEGTPSDCVVAGLNSICPETDIVVAGCNTGANLGEAVLGRSGTVSAAVEAAFFDVPAIAVSLYVPPSMYEDGMDTIEADAFADAVAAGAYLADHSFAADVFEHAEYLNVNAPTADRSTGEMVITQPSHVYEIDAVQEGETIQVRNSIWEKMEEGTIDDPPGTDRHAIVNDKISVSPLTAPHSTQRTDALAELAENYRD